MVDPVIILGPPCPVGAKRRWAGWMEGSYVIDLVTVDCRVHFIRVERTNEGLGRAGARGWSWPLAVVPGEVYVSAIRKRSRYPSSEWVSLAIRTSRSRSAGEGSSG